MHLGNSSHSKASHRSMTTYIVPCVAKAVHIVEILRTVPSGLHMAELRSITQYPQAPYIASSGHSWNADISITTCAEPTC